jgi:hypothetical protein|tara:strand:+ start:181 stop:783 length:603 start_codon:yes stop_codon:yes gene_type:complete
MKKSELKSYIREEIKSTLTVEDTQQDIKDTEKLTLATQNLKKAKEEAGIEENGEKDHWADYTDIGMFYLEAHGNMYQGKEQKLTDSQYEELGKKIVDQLYDGDVSKAYDETYKAVKGNELKYKGSLKEDEDQEPSKKDIKKTKGLAKAKEELALLTREMKSLAREYSKAEGEDKEKLVKTLKAKTKLKKELESILDNKKI